LKNSASGVRCSALISTAIVLVAALPGVALAQQAGGETFSPAAASQNTAGAAQDVPAERVGPSSGVQDIVVTARRSSESQQRVPIAITTVTTQRLQDLSVRDVIDVQKVTPGLYISTNKTGGKVRLTLRGQIEADDSLTGDRSVGVYIDGASYEGNYGLTTALVDLAQVEVLKGPQGTLYGKNTTGGALNITTQHPTYEWGGYADLLYGSYNKMQALGVVNAPLIADKLSVRLVGQILERDGYYKEGNGIRSNNDNNRYARILVRADPAESVRILVSADYARQNNGQGHAAAPDETFLDPANVQALQAVAAQLGLNPASAADRMTAYNAVKVYFDQQKANPRLGFANSNQGLGFDEYTNWGVTGNIAVDVGPVTLTSITAYRHLDRSGLYDTDNSPFDLFVQRQATRLNSFSQELRLSAIDGQGLDWQAGLYYNRNTGFDQNILDSYIYVNPGRAPIVDSGIVSSSKAAFGQAVYAITPKWRVTGGLRYTMDYREINSRNRIDTSQALLPLPPGAVSRCAQLAPALGGPVFPNCGYVASVKNNKLTWLVSTDWSPVEKVMLYASVGLGYRAGAFTRPGTSVIASQAALTATFTPYRPETVTNYEVGFKADLLDRRLRVNGAAYYQDYKDKQANVRDFTNGVLLNLVRNAASATIYGGELEVTAVPIDGLTLEGSAGYVHARYDQYMARDSAGNLLDLSATKFPVPEWTFNVGGTYEIPLRDGSVRLYANYQWKDDVEFYLSPRPAGASQKAYGLLDARISWSIASQGLDIAVFGKNLTDKIYFSNLSPAGPYSLGVLGDPREFGIQVRKTF